MKIFKNMMLVLVTTIILVGVQNQTWATIFENNTEAWITITARDIDPININPKSQAKVNIPKESDAWIRVYENANRAFPALKVKRSVSPNAKKYKIGVQQTGSRKFFTYEAE